MWNRTASHYWEALRKSIPAAAAGGQGPLSCSWGAWLSRGNMGSWDPRLEPERPNVVVCGGIHTLSGRLSLLICRRRPRGPSVLLFKTLETENMILAPSVVSHHTQGVRLQGLMPRLKPLSPTGWFSTVCIRTSFLLLLMLLLWSRPLACLPSAPPPHPVPQPAPLLARAASITFPTFNLSFPIQEPPASLGSWSSRAPVWWERVSALFPGPVVFSQDLSSVCLHAWDWWGQTYFKNLPPVPSSVLD